MNVESNNFMTDLIFIGIVVACFRRQRTLRPLLRETVGAPMETIIVGLIALLLFVYLFVAMIRPEKF